MESGEMRVLNTRSGNGIQNGTEAPAVDRCTILLPFCSSMVQWELVWGSEASEVFSIPLGSFSNIFTSPEPIRYPSHVQEPPDLVFHKSCDEFVRLEVLSPTLSGAHSLFKRGTTSLPEEKSDPNGSLDHHFSSST